MTPISRLWLSSAAIGAGTIHLAVGASAPVLLMITLVGLGAAELGWGAVTLVRGRALAPGAALFGALIPVFVWGAVATLGSGLGVPATATGLPLQPMATATLFDLFLAGSLALALRRTRRAASTGTTTTERVPNSGVQAESGANRPEPTRIRHHVLDSAHTPAGETAGGWRFLAALTLAALVVSGLTTPALAATDAGAHAVPHGSHGLPSAPTPETPAGHHH
ncbi:hypothetical protein E3O55_01805 [Cryobacterium sp. MDB1-18-2]|uniref:hypothetical protein n=1 Tax=unclassified Cryobacterium TaxID=2649013 RepID=UPI00106CA066|nr:MULTISPECIES: hypothetical protein [unclassified Cryobacterium]TFC35259.1 hypothetical protein E3O55_01805 [Cryobacterium sp. MDB1-18-2]TFC45039.1 hypothetical protein E3O50_03950 [Cryobacterium sp. MDB1-18-1]